MFGCSCKYSDAWRCATARKLRTVSCSCACHRDDPQRRVDEEAIHRHRVKGTKDFEREQREREAAPIIVSDSSGPAHAPLDSCHNTGSYDSGSSGDGGGSCGGGD